MREYKSRLTETEEKNNVRSAVVFGGLTIVLIVLGLVFGIPLFSKFVGLFTKNSSQQQSTQSTTTLLAPNVSTLPKYTNQQSISIKGTAQPNSTIKIFFNNSSDETVTDGSGNFAANVTLTKGVNTIYAKTVDSNGNESQPSVSYSVNYTNQTPNLTVNTPQNNQNFYGSASKSLDIQGSTDAGNTVTINDHIAILDANGKFSYSIDLQNGDNQLKIVSTDLAGNKKEIDLKVIFNP